MSVESPQENEKYNHWDAEILNLRNALLKMELKQERMALELKMECDRRLKEQEQKIENFSTMVINSTVDDRDLDRRNKKNNRRKTWCSRIPSSVPDEKPQENKKPFPKESPLANSMFSMRRERLRPLPPSSKSLMESKDTVPPLLELDGNALTDKFQSFPSSGSSIESILQEPPPVFFCERKRRSSEKSVDEEMKKKEVLESSGISDFLKSPPTAEKVRGVQFPDLISEMGIFRSSPEVEKTPSLRLDPSLRPFVVGLMDSFSPCYPSLPPFEVEGTYCVPLVSSREKKQKKKPCKIKKPNDKWTDEETIALKRGVAEHGKGKWQKIKNFDSILKNKDRTDRKSVV